MATEPMKAAVMSFESPPEALTIHAKIKLGASVHTMAIQKKIFWNNAENWLFVAMIPTAKNRKRAAKAATNKSFHKNKTVGCVTYIPVFLSSLTALGWDSTVVFFLLK